MTDRTAVITGSSSGIGAATAKAFLAADWTVYATARDESDIEDLAEAGCETAELDVTVEADVDGVIDRVVDEQGRIDCLVNNAGYGQFGPVEDVPTGAVHDQFDVNVYGPHRLIRAVLPHMRAQGEGTIVNVSSVAGRVATPGMGVYCGSKFALEGMSDALRAEVDPDGVDVVLVEPGPVETNFDARVAEELDDGLERSATYDDIYTAHEDKQLLGGTSALASDPDDVADVVLEAACSPDPQARYPVGQFAKLSLLSRHLPDGVRDALFRLARRIL